MGERNADKGLGGDAQGTKVGSPSTVNDGPSEREESSTGAGGEATIADRDSSEHDREHRSGYGGKGGKPDTSSDTR